MRVKIFRFELVSRCSQIVQHEYCKLNYIKVLKK